MLIQLIRCAASLQQWQGRRIDQPQRHGHGRLQAGLRGPFKHRGAEAWGWVNVRSHTARQRYRLEEIQRRALYRLHACERWLAATFAEFQLSAQHPDQSIVGNADRGDLRLEQAGKPPLEQRQDLDAWPASQLHEQIALVKQHVRFHSMERVVMHSQHS